MGDSQSWKARGKLSPRDGILYQTASRLPVANQVFLGSWTVDIHQEGHSQRSVPQRRHTAHLTWCTPGTPRRLSGAGEVIKMHSPPGTVRSPSTCLLHCSDPGMAQNACPTESVPLWSTQGPEPEQLRPGKCMKPRALFGQFPCRATWSLTSVDWESTHAVS